MLAGSGESRTMAPRIPRWSPAPVSPPGPELRQCGVLQRQGCLVWGAPSSLASAEHPGAWVLGPVDAVPETHQPVALSSTCFT